jgi:hypothetical protein
MKKKILLCLALASVISLGAAMGSFARYSTSAVTPTNTLHAAVFSVKGANLYPTAAAAGSHAITLEIQPGKTVDYPISLNSTGTDMAYSITLTRTNNLAPVSFTLYPAKNDQSSGIIKDGSPAIFPFNGFYNQFSYTFTAPDILPANSGTTKYYVLEATWPVDPASDGTPDINYQGLSDTFSVSVVGTQAFSVDGVTAYGTSGSVAITSKEFYDANTLVISGNYLYGSGHFTAIFTKIAITHPGDPQYYTERIYDSSDFSHRIGFSSSVTLTNNNIQLNGHGSFEINTNGLF